MKKNLLLITASTLMLFSCRKDPVETPGAVPPDPVMRYTEFNSFPLPYGQQGLMADLDQDGQADIFFGVQLVGDAANKVDKRQWIVVTSLSTALAVNALEESPRMNAGDSIPMNAFNGYGWNEAVEILLMERVEDIAARISWRGNWMQANRSYLPVQLLRGSKRYNGWIEISADTSNQRLLLHRAAVATVADLPVKAGI